MNREEEIRIIAYHIWEEENYRHGYDAEHWLKAEAIWEERHKNEASMDLKTESIKPKKPGKKSRPGSNRPCIN